MKTYKASAKVNIFLKITGKRDGYHEILSRFMLVEDLFDTLYFFAKDDKSFIIEGDFGCSTEQNTIYKAYLALQDSIDSNELKELMKNYGVHVTKRIPAFAGLGGGSSDAATYLKMCNEVLNLDLSLDELASIGAKVGADVPFFIYGYSSANVSGIGEVVDFFEEDSLVIETFTPNIEISTPAVYKKFRETFFKELDDTEYLKLSKMSSKDVLNSYSLSEANDLFEPALELYPDLKYSRKDGWFYSGSGSSFFRIKIL